jgi:hypothetical protein
MRDVRKNIKFTVFLLLCQFINHPFRFFDKNRHKALQNFIIKSWINQFSIFSPIVICDQKETRLKKFVFPFTSTYKLQLTRTIQQSKWCSKELIEKWFFRKIVGCQTVSHQVWIVNDHNDECAHPHLTDALKLVEQFFVQR